MIIDDARATFLAELLGTCQDKERALDFLGDFANDSSPLVREGAIIGIAQLNTDLSRELLRMMVEKEKNEQLRRMALECLKSNLDDIK